MCREPDRLGGLTAHDGCESLDDGDVLVRYAPSSAQTYPRQSVAICLTSLGCNDDDTGEIKVLDSECTSG